MIRLVQMSVLRFLIVLGSIIIFAALIRGEPLTTVGEGVSVVALAALAALLKAVDDLLE